MMRSFPDFTPARGKHLLVALSGGADSMALLGLLAEKREALGLRLSAAHVDHCIRGADSAADAEFCQAVCREWNIPIYMTRIDVPKIANDCAEGIETLARKLRYEYLRRVKDAVGADWIALAHHLDDQAETVLMHLLRGAGLDGAGGMSELSGDLYRPLLHMPKRALTDYLRERGVSWREDATNREVCTPRNAIRLHVSPLLEKSYPMYASALSRFAETARTEGQFVQKCANVFLEAHLQAGPYGARILHPEEADDAVLRRAIRTVCDRELSYDKLMEIVRLCAKSHGKTEVSGDLTLERTPNALYFLRPQPVLQQETTLNLQGKTCLDGICTITAGFIPAVPIRNNPLKQALRRDALEGAVLRTRRNGDHIRPLGCGERLLSDYLIDRKLDRPLRDFLPLIAVGSNVLWVVGHGISEDAKLRSDTALAVQLECQFITQESGR